MFDNQNISDALTFNYNINEVVSRLSRPLHVNFGIDTFSYMKIYNNKILYISDDMELVEFYIKNKLYNLTFYQTHISKIGNQEKYLVLWDDLRSVFFSKSNIGLKNGVSIYKKYNNYVEMWNFLSNNKDQAMYETYINNIPYFERFIIYFKNRANEILDTSNARLFLLRDSHLILDTNPSIAENHRHNFLLMTILSKIKTSTKGEVVISKRELQCLYLLSLGKSVKEIANAFHLSSRTVEYHINKLKSKLNCQYQSELLRIFYEDLEEYYALELEPLKKLFNNFIAPKQKLFV
jgi:DNA-binding CsgD family transcriptional regulator